VQRIGLGQHMMKAAQDISQHHSMAGVMLKCQTSNHAALAFYKRLSFQVDEMSPSPADCFLLLSKTNPETDTLR